MNQFDDFKHAAELLEAAAKLHREADAHYSDGNYVLAASCAYKSWGYMSMANVHQEHAAIFFAKYHSDEVINEL